MSGYAEGLYHTQAEELHGLLYGVHDDLAFGALEKINAALVVLHGIEHHMDLRSVIREHIRELESLRGAIEAAMTLGHSVRSQVLRATGCDNTCTEAREARRRRATT